MTNVLPPLNARRPHERFPFDPTYGHRLDALLRIEPPDTEPPDFADFWRGTYAAARAVDPAPQLGGGWREPGHTVREISFDALGDGGVGTRRIGGWLTVPHEPPRYGIVWGHGYDGRPCPDLPPPGPPAAVLFPCARGFDRSAAPDLPNNSAAHVVHGIDSRDTYLHRGCCADLWAAATVLLDLVPDIAGRLAYYGSSFGGGIGALAVPWDNRFRRCVLDIPSFGHHPLRLQSPCFGSGEAVRQHHAVHPDVVDVLRYYDAATAATHMRCPTLVTPAIFDPAVPPPGQFAVYNALRCAKRAVCRDWAHVDWPHPAEASLLDAETGSWLAALRADLLA